MSIRRPPTSSDVRETAGLVTDALAADGRDRYLRVLLIPAGPLADDVLELLCDVQRRVASIASCADGLADGTEPVASAHVAWALATTHRALAAQALAVGVDPDVIIDRVVAEASALVAASRARPEPTVAAMVRAHAAHADDALVHACRFARDDRFPEVLLDWTQLAAEHLLVLHVLAGVRWPR